MHILDSNQVSILNAYRAGAKCRTLAAQYSVPYITMWKYLKARGCAFQRMLLDSTQQAALVRDHEAGMRYRELGERYGISTASAKNYALRHGLKAHGQYRKKAINHAFFDTLTEESLWVLGWMYSDGTVSTEYNHFSVSVHRNDEAVLHTIGKLMGSDVESIYRSKRSLMSCFFACDRYLHSRLISLGCVPNKSLIIRYPAQLIENWQHWAFLRGVWEGDGHISLKSQGNRPGFNCELASGSLGFLQDVQSLLRTKLGIDSKIHERANSNSKRLTIRGGKEPILRFLDLIYRNGDAKCRLERKYAVYQQMREVAARPSERGKRTDLLDSSIT